MTTVYTCPNCSGTKVQEFHAVWVDPNKDYEVVDAEWGLAEAYPDLYWCDDCQRHPGHLIEKEVTP